MRSEYQVFGGGAGGATLVWHDPLVTGSGSNYVATAIGTGGIATFGPSNLQVSGNNLAGFKFTLNSGLIPNLGNFMMRITLVSANTGNVNKQILKLATGWRNSASTFFVQGMASVQANASFVGPGTHAIASNDSTTQAASTAQAATGVPLYLQITALRLPGGTGGGVIFVEASNVNPTGLPWGSLAPASAEALTFSGGLSGSFAPSFTVLGDAGSPDFGGPTTVKDLYIYSLDGITT